MFVEIQYQDLKLTLLCFRIKKTLSGYVARLNDWIKITTTFCSLYLHVSSI